MLKFISTTRIFLQTFSEKLEEFAQMDQGQSDLQRELHINKLYSDRSNKGLNSKCNYIYHNKFFDKKKTNEFLEDQYNRMKRAITRRYQTHYGYATSRDTLEKGYFKDNVTEALFKICRVASERTIVNKNKQNKQKLVAKKKEVVAPTAVPIYVLYTKEKTK